MNELLAIVAGLALIGGGFLALDFVIERAFDLLDEIERRRWRRAYRRRQR